MSGPGGVGKGTVCAVLVDQHPDLWLSRSWTTRQQRPGEADDSYVFVDKAQFQERIDSGGFLEWAEFLDNFYGTPLPDPPEGMDVILEIDVQGARQVLAVMPERPVLIFLEAPSPEEQQRRLKNRGDPEHKVQARLAKAAEEATAGGELGAQMVVNHDIQRTADEIYEIITAARR